MYEMNPHAVLGRLCSAELKVAIRKCKFYQKELLF